MKQTFKITFKNKVELDSMTPEEIRSYRTSILISDELDWKRYIAEFSIYNNIRFKDGVFELYDKWSKSDEEDHVLITKSIEMLGGQETYYERAIELHKTNLGESKYELY